MESTFRAPRRIIMVIVAIGLGAAFWWHRETVWDAFAPSSYGEIRFEVLGASARPNEYLVCPKKLCVSREPDATAPIYDVPVDMLRQEATKTWQGDGDLSVVHRSGDGLQVRYIQRSKALRFPDLVTVQFVPVTSGSSTLAVYSRSLIGYYDFGANCRRVSRWIGDLGRLPTSRPSTISCE